MHHPFYATKKSPQFQVYVSSMADLVCALEQNSCALVDEGLRKLLATKTGGLYWKGL